MISGVHSLMPLTHLAHPPPTTSPATLCSLYLRLLCFVPFPVFILFFLPFPYVHLFCVLNRHMSEVIRYLSFSDEFRLA